MKSKLSIYLSLLLMMFAYPLWAGNTIIEYENDQYIQYSQEGPLSEEDPNILEYDNVIYAKPFSCFIGKTFELPIIMENSEEISGIEFFLKLPTGVYVEKDEDGEYIINLGERTTTRNHVAQASQKQDGSIYVLCYSSKSKTFAGNNGVVLNIPLIIDPELMAGDYTIELNGIVLSKSNSSTIEIDQINVGFTAKNAFVLGDANGDKIVNSEDVTTTVSYILDNSPMPFVFDGADTNEDKEINICDLTKIIDIIKNSHQ